jgi:small subunit ribosomal protein S15
MALTKEETASLVKKFGKNEKDTGSAAVQVALLTNRISDLTAHLKANKQDAAARRSLFILVGKRRGLLTYLAKNDSEAYAKLISELGLRK